MNRPTKNNTAFYRSKPARSAASPNGSTGKNIPPERQQLLTICNAGIYAATRQALESYLPILSSRPQVVHKEIDGQLTPIEEYFITDLIEFMVADGRSVGYQVTASEMETLGVDDPVALEKAQRRFMESLKQDRNHGDG